MLMITMRMVVKLIYSGDDGYDRNGQDDDDDDKDDENDNGDDDDVLFMALPTAHFPELLPVVTAETSTLSCYVLTRSMLNIPAVPAQHKQAAKGINSWVSGAQRVQRPNVSHRVVS